MVHSDTTVIMFEIIFFFYPKAQSKLSTAQRKMAVEIIVEKGENAGKQQFFPFLIFFYPMRDRYGYFSNIKLVICKCF